MLLLVLWVCDLRAMQLFLQPEKVEGGWHAMIQKQMENLVPIRVCFLCLEFNLFNQKNGREMAFSVFPGYPTK